MDSQMMKEIGLFASEIVAQAGENLVKMREKWMQVDEKGGHFDLVTTGDLRTEEFLTMKILEKYPTHGIVGEEGDYKQGFSNCDTVWIIDPIDGTTNFIHNFPFYGISVGVVHKGEGIVGVVYNPVTNELFYGEKDFGAFVNGKRLSLTKPILLKEALVNTTLFWDESDWGSKLHPGISEIYRKVRGIRMVGGAAISICEIAKGTMNAYIVPALAPWDYAGGVIILKEAGGKVSQLNGTDVTFECGSSFIAADPSIHDEIKGIFSKFY